MEPQCYGGTALVAAPAGETLLELDCSFHCAAVLAHDKGGLEEAQVRVVDEGGGMHPVECGAGLLQEPDAFERLPHAHPQTPEVVRSQRFADTVRR